jgi:probable rRNA maturation factor
MQEHPLLELYITVGDDQQNAEIEKMLAPVDLDSIALQTLRTVSITQPVMLTLLVTDDKSIQEMNKQYREQNKPTDVLSFPLLDKPLVKAPTELLWQIQESEAEQKPQPAFVTPPDMILNLGDIVMSWPTLVRQAQESGHSPTYELLYLLSHGVLHLVGYDDQTEAGYQAMVSIQQSVMQAVGQKA